jgi:hypothetical protein
MTTLVNYIEILSSLGRDDGNKSGGRQFLEMLLMYVWSRLGPGYYLKAQLYKQDSSWKNALGYLSYKQYYKRVSQLNSRLYQRSSQNKVIEKAILTAYGQPTPQLLGHYHGQNGLTANGKNLRTLSDLSNLLNSLEANSRVCFKLTESWGGRGFRAFDCKAENSVVDLATEAVLSHRELFDQTISDEVGGILIERYLEQHPRLAAYNESSANTVRVLVRQMEDGSVVCLGAFLRVGRAGSLIDNGDAGGIIFPLDLHSGRIQAGFSTKSFGTFFPAHPDSGVAMEGEVLYGFQEALELSRQVLHAFPEINFAGADIAITAQGPVVLEINVLPDYIDFAICQLPSKKALS